MKGFTLDGLEKNRILAILVINISLLILFWRNMNWSIGARSLTHVNIAIKRSIGSVIWRDMKWYVHCDGKPLQTKETSNKLWGCKKCFRNLVIQSCFLSTAYVKNILQTFENTSWNFIFLIYKSELLFIMLYFINFSQKKHKSLNFIKNKDVQIPHCSIPLYCGSLLKTT